MLLTGNEAVYQVVSITGLNPPKAVINLTTIAGLDGATFNSSKLETRDIVLMVKINGDIERNRQNLYNFFRTKEWCKFYYSNANRDVYIEGYVESVECELFTKSEIAQISILCPYPYFKGLYEIIDDISTSLATFVFPFSINYEEPIPFSTQENSRTANVYNDSASSTGLVIEADFYDSVESLLIKNTMTGDNFILVYSFLENDRVFINTNIGQKSVRLMRNGVESNIFAAIQAGSVFFQLAPGDNIFGYLADDGDSNASVHILFKHYDCYRGV